MTTLPHTARVCTAFLGDAGIDVMFWPAKSPDINPVGNVWALLGDKVKKRDNVDCEWGYSATNKLTS